MWVRFGRASKWAGRVRPSCVVQASRSDRGCEQLVFMHPKGNARDGGSGRVDLGLGTVGSGQVELYGKVGWVGSGCANKWAI